LNDAIRQQEKKIKQTIGSDQIRVSGGASPESDEDDHIEELWNVTTEDGSRVETLDPNDPRVQKALRDEASKSETGMLGMARSTPESASEQLLLLLTLLRERIKVEAAFANDEKGRNLRILAYCLQVATNKDREEIVRQRTGSSVDVSAYRGMLLLYP
jgi:cyclophilin family peptidyl-prolyl cis-trans isomerase